MEFEKQVDEVTEMTTLEAPLTYGGCFSRIMKSCWPSLCFWLLTYISYPFYIEILSDLGDVNLIIGFQFGYIWLESFIKLIGRSMNGGFCVLATHAFGANERRLMGYYLHKAFIAWICTVSVAFIASVSGTIYTLKKIHYDHSVTDNIIRYMFYSLLGIVLHGLFDLLRSFTIAQRNFWFPLLCQIIGTSLELGLSFYFVRMFGWGLLAIGIGKAVGEGVKVLFMVVYLMGANTFKESCFFFTKDSLRGFWSQYWNQIKIAASIFLEWVFAQAIYVIATTITSEDKDAFIDFYRIIVFPQCLILSVGEVIGVLVGVSMGEKNDDKARLFVRAGTLLSMIGIFTVDLLLFLLRDTLPGLSGGSMSARTITRSLLLLYCICFPFDLFHKTLGFAGRAIGKEGSTLIRLIICLVIIGVPLTISLEYLYERSVYWLWAGLTISYAFAMIALGRIVGKTDFSVQVEYVTNRLLENGKEHISIELSKI